MKDLIQRGKHGGGGFVTVASQQRGPGFESSWSISAWALCDFLPQSKDIDGLA